MAAILRAAASAAAKGRDCQPYGSEIELDFGLYAAWRLSDEILFARAFEPATLARLPRIPTHAEEDIQTWGALNAGGTEETHPVPDKA